ncbi:MAG: MBL fold metallo-hydrolase [Gloeobacteraceae cyanobacterium ES-bin-316]|nr:MBL fold metallo-hydrolase [Ferruginibacter sp.]
MLIHSISSGSEGNSYVLEVNGDLLVLDCGVPYMEIARTVNFRVTRIAGCLLTHEHGDHSKCAVELIRRGIKVYSSKGTGEIIQGCQPIQKMKEYKIGNFTVMPFDVPHDAAEPFGYLIRHSNLGDLVFITDAMYCKYKFKGLKHILVEANYSEELLKNDPLFMQKRIKHSHMSIETCCDFISLNKDQVETVTLLHLSNRNSNMFDYEKRIKQITGVRVYIAEKNKTINLNF